MDVLLICCRFTWQVFEESPESYLAPSRGAIWGYPEVGTIHGASGVFMRYMIRYGSVWLVVSDRSRLQDDLSAGRYACML